MYKDTCITKISMNGAKESFMIRVYKTFTCYSNYLGFHHMKRRTSLALLCILLLFSVVITFVVLEFTHHDMGFDVHEVRLAYYTINPVGANATIATTVSLRNNNFMSVELRDLTLSGTHPSYSGTLISGNYYRILAYMRSRAFFHFPIEAQYLLENDKKRALLSEVSTKCSEDLNNTVAFNIQVTGAYETWLKSGMFTYSTQHDLRCSSFVTPEVLNSIAAFIAVP